MELSELDLLKQGLDALRPLPREHFEAINHRDAIHYVEDVVHKAEPLSEWQVRNLHRLVLKNIDDDNAGVYRKTNVAIARGLRQASSLR